MNIYLGMSQSNRTLPQYQSKMSMNDREAILIRGILEGLDIINNTDGNKEVSKY